MSMRYSWKKISYEVTITEAGDGYIVVHYTILYTFVYVLNFSYNKIF